VDGENPSTGKRQIVDPEGELSPVRQSSSCTIGNGLTATSLSLEIRFSKSRRMGLRSNLLAKDFPKQLQHKQSERCAWSPSRTGRCESDRDAPLHSNLVDGKGLRPYTDELLADDAYRPVIKTPFSQIPDRRTRPSAPYSMPCPLASPFFHSPTYFAPLGYVWIPCPLRLLSLN
jgi:hypothetical protein